MVSPLIALMRDQLARLPPHLPAAMLWGGQSKQEAMQVLTDLKVSIHMSVCPFVLPYSCLCLYSWFRIYALISGYSIAQSCTLIFQFCPSNICFPSRVRDLQP